MVRAGDLGDQAVDRTNIDTSASSARFRGKHVAGCMRMGENQHTSITNFPGDVSCILRALVRFATTRRGLDDYEARR